LPGEEGRTLLGQKTELVGRDLELGTLEGALWRRLSAPKPSTVQGVLLLAPPGVGKSRLVREALLRATRDGLSFSLWLGRGDPTRAGAPLGLLSSALRKAIGLSEGEPPTVLSAKLWAYLSKRLSPVELPMVAEFLGELLGAPARSESIYLRAARQDPRLMNDQLRRAWLAFLSAECRAHPVLLWLEDLHWGDAASLHFIDEAMSAL
jgi:predicted ATPase